MLCMLGLNAVTSAYGHALPFVYLMWFRAQEIGKSRPLCIRAR